MDVLPDEQEILIQETAREFFAAEATPALVRMVEKDPERYSPQLWKKLAELGWLGISLPEECGGQGLPLTYLGLIMEEVGRHLAPVPMHSTMVPALVLARYGSARQRELLAQVTAGELILCHAIQGPDGSWAADGRGLSARRDGADVVLEGQRSFVDNFAIARKCLVLYRFESGEVGAALIDARLPGITRTDLVTTAKDGECHVRFNNVRVAPADVIDPGARAGAMGPWLCDLSTALMTAQLVGAARRAMEFAVEYAKQREAFGHPIGSFQSLQHLAADMLIAVDGAQLLVREAIWRLSQDLPASIEVSQAKAFAGDKCIFVGRSAQQIHGGIGFMMECDLQLWY
ncbi:MAG: hypothetical protein JWP65_467, partial [Ramlibacter sp.]|uniref:acyl-CoA dehydrogenase family protein n=1 Tax=Ramlibacter sp. TaxID=1917967 RepID=UPI0026367FC7